VRKKKRLIAVVDDDEHVREAIRGLMRSMRLAVETFSSAEDFLGSPHLTKTACLIADVNMPAMNGIELFQQLAKAGTIIPTILITAFPTEDDRALALKCGVISYLVKPFSEEDLINGIRAALHSSLGSRA